MYQVVIINDYICGIKDLDYIRMEELSLSLSLVFAGGELCSFFPNCGSSRSTSTSEFAGIAHQGWFVNIILWRFSDRVLDEFT